MGYRDVVLGTPGLAGYWELADAPGSASAADSQGGTTLAASGVTFGASPLITTGTAASLGGTSTLINSASTPAGAVAGTSVEAWFRWTPGAAAEQTIVRNGKGSNAYSLVINGSGTAAHHLYILNEIIAWHDTGYVVDGGVHHVLLSVSAGPTWDLYVDGVRVYSATGASNTPSGGFQVGCSDAGNRCFQGVIDEAAVYTAALSQADAVAHYSAGVLPRSGFPGRPPRPSPQPAWSRQLLSAHVPGGYGPTVPDLAGPHPGTLGGSSVAWGGGPAGPCLAYAGNTGVVPAAGGTFARGLAQLTVAVFAQLDVANVNAGAPAIRALSSSSDNAGSAYRLDLNLGAGAQRLEALVGGQTAVCPDPLPFWDWNVYVLRFNAGLLDVFFAGRRVGSGAGGPPATPANGSVLIGGTGVSGGNFSWAGGIGAHYVWGRALADAEIAALSADPFAPVRPAAARLAALAPPSPVLDPVPWLPRLPALVPTLAPAAPAFAGRAALLPAAAPDVLPWLSRPGRPAPPRPTLAPSPQGWSAALAPAPAAIPWLARPARARAAPPASPLAPAHAGWRPEFAGGFAPAVRHALVRFWRGPEAHMPRLEDGEPAWATDTKSLWMGSASGNVRIGP